nr:GGDEF domain-containing protein [Porphyrobacter sp.]
MSVNPVSIITKVSRPMGAGLVLVPLAVLSVVFGLMVLAAIASDQIEIVSPMPLLIAAAAIYAATLALLSWHGLAIARKLEALGAYDALTGLPNRHSLQKAIRKASSGDEEVAIAIIDLDSFKQINDHFGHAVGDQLICYGAQLLREVCGSEARCFRLSGDEFAAIMTGQAAGNILEGMCRSLLDRLVEPAQIGGRAIALGASVGLARSTPQVRLGASEMMRRADVAMYTSKRSGKMRCTWFSENFDRRRERMREIEDEIRDGIAAGEFALAYQPL